MSTMGAGIPPPPLPPAAAAAAAGGSGGGGIPAPIVDIPSEIPKPVCDVIHRYHLSDTFMTPEILNYVSSMSISDLEDFIDGNLDASLDPEIRKEIARALNVALQQSHPQHNNDIASGPSTDSLTDQQPGPSPSAAPSSGTNSPRGRKGSSGEVDEPSPQADEDFHEVVRKGRAKAKPKAAGKKSPTGTGAGSGEMVDSLSKGTTPVGANTNREASSRLKSILSVGKEEQPASVGEKEGKPVREAAPCS
mmetsp:Transcript_25280/g.72972  ORF Transcript_25280/g.72972 Transcript_25280/m.72972 type:complete len:249 (-) Transcript_25280:944-1690(-)